MKHFKQIGLSALVGVFAFLAFNSTSFNISADSLKASVLNAFSRNTNIYNIARSKSNPEAFTFKYQFAKVKTKKGQSNFDLPIIPFDEKVAQKALERDYFPQGFGRIRDAWGYPIRENAYMKLGTVQIKRQTFLDSFKIQKALAFDADANVPGLMNCRANTNVNGYFKAYFEDVALNNGVGYADAIHGQARRTEACQVLQDIATLIKLDTTTVTPDIIFMADPGNIPANALAAASSYFGSYLVGPDNGSLHKHIISHQDPTPGTGNFDAFIITNFNGISWDVDSILNTSTYDFYTVMTHEVLHALGFRGLLPSVITSTNDAHQHTTFDLNTYKDSTLVNRFFNAATELLQVPVGAPSSWFINNAVVYRGTKNIFDTFNGGMITPDGIRPVYSPPSWEQGSSLSHFDITRANGATYVMNPSIGTNTTRVINNDEKEVLCHVGYMVQGMNGCELPTPIAVNDSISLPSNSTASICINFLTNDFSLNAGGTLVAYSVLTTSIQPGDVIVYYMQGNCLGTISPTAEGAARSILFTPTTSSARRVLTYNVIDSISWRISNSAKITLSGCDSSPDEYICNGGFENGAQGFQGSGSLTQPSTVDFWGSLYGTADWAGYYNSYYSNLGLYGLVLPHVCAFQGCIINIPDSSQKAIFMYKSKDYGEGIVTSLKQPLISGAQYTISYDVFAHVANDADFGCICITYNPSAVTSANILTKFRQGSATVIPDYLPNDSLLPVFSQTITNPVLLQPQNNWTHIQSVFTATGSYDFLAIHPQITQNYPEDQIVIFYVDNVSIKEIIQGDNTVSGKVYSDQNSNGSLNVNESGLNGIQVGLFAQGSTTPLQTVTTQNIPHLGEYSFTNVSDGTYNVALLSENLYPTVTEPVTNNPVLISGYTHAKQITVTSGQTSASNNFGVILAGTLVDVCPNISGAQPTIPSGYQMLDGGCVQIDVCSNLSGAQMSVPVGYSAVGTQCDACSNITGIQSNVPTGYANVNGQCIQTGTDTVSVTDLCPNITGVQVTVPAGYQLVNGQCMKKLILSPTKIPTATPASSSVNTSR